MVVLSLRGGYVKYVRILGFESFEENEKNVKFEGNLWEILCYLGHGQAKSCVVVHGQ